MRNPRKTRGRWRAPAVLALSLAVLLGGAVPSAAQEQEEEQQEEEREARTDVDITERRRQELEPRNPLNSERPFFYLFPTAAQTGLDTTRIGGESFTDNVTVFVPAVVSIRTSSERSRLYAIYEPQFEHFAEHAELNSWNHSAAMAFDHQIGPRLSVGAGGSFLRTADPTRAIAEIPLVLDRGEFLSARGYLSLGYSLSRRTMVDFTVDHGLLRYDALSGLPDVGIDSRGTGGIVGLSHRLNEAHTLALRYSYVQQEALEGPEDLPEELAILLPLADQHGVDLGWTYDAARGLTVSLSAGVASGHTLSWIGSATLEKEWRHVRMMVGYQRLISSYENLAPRQTPGGAPDINQPLLPLSTIGSAVDIVSGSLEGRTGRIQISGRLQLSLSSFDDVGPVADGLAAGAGFKYQLTDRIQPYVLAEYITQGLSPEVGIRRSRGRYAAGLVLVLGPGPRNTSLQLELERRRSLLPYAGAKRPG